MAPLVSVRNLSKVFSLPGGFFGKRRELRALDGISLDVEEGESLGVVGESGCGKSTLVRCIVRLLRPSAGKILFRGVDIASLSARKLRPLRKDMQIVFQDPYSSLHPRLDVETLIAEPLRLHKIGGRKSQLARVHELLAAVGLQPDILRRRPAALSGGQRQRVSIARALSLSPKLLVCDEAVSALDVSVQAQIIELLRGLQAQHGLTYLFISHDLGVIRQLCDRVVVMYLGKIVEIGKVEDLLSVPAHPYTQALIASVPEIRSGATIAPPRGEMPSALNPPPGCRFHTRCPLAIDRCRQSEPELRATLLDRLVACHLAPGVTAPEGPKEVSSGI